MQVLAFGPPSSVELGSLQVKLGCRLPGTASFRLRDSAPPPVPQCKVEKGEGRHPESTSEPHILVCTCSCVHAYTNAHHTHIHATKPGTTFISFLLAIRKWPTIKRPLKPSPSTPFLAFFLTSPQPHTPSLLPLNCLCPLLPSL